MTRLAKLSLIVFLLGASFPSSGQHFRSSYFLNQTTYSHHLNPAFIPSTNYISIPALAQAGVMMQSNVGLSNFLFPSPDPEYALVTFMHASVDADQFINSIPEISELDLGFVLMPLSVGFQSFGGYNTFTVSVHSNSLFNIPADLFRLMKTGPSSAAGSTYSLGDIRFMSNNYLEVSVGHAREITDRLSAGARFKTYWGIGAFDTHISKLNISMMPDKWEIHSAAELNVYANGIVAETDTGDNGAYLSGVDVDFSGIGGKGIGFDLGATYQVMEDIFVSAAIIDLGYIQWSSSVRAKTGSNRFEFDGFENLSFMDDDENNTNSIDNQLEGLVDDLVELSRMYLEPDQSGYRQRIPTTLIFGVEYNMPFYRRMSVGLMNYTRFNEYNPWNEGRLAVNVTPLDYLGISVNYGLSRYGSSLGWLLNLNPRGVNIYVGSDNMFTRVTPQYIPVNQFNASFFMGTNITFGR